MYINEYSLISHENWQQHGDYKNLTSGIHLKNVKKPFSCPLSAIKYKQTKCFNFSLHPWYSKWEFWPFLGLPKLITSTVYIQHHFAIKNPISYQNFLKGRGYLLTIGTSPGHTNHCSITKIMKVEISVRSQSQKNLNTIGLDSRESIWSWFVKPICFVI